jgi:2-hydroxychromene-2-carboxylate isomerase
MSTTVDYYFAPQSPWACLGHERFVALARRHGATVRVKPVDLGGKVFPVSGGLPLAQRPLQRQKYRLVELERWSRQLGVPIHIKPKFFPVAGDPAALLIIAADAAAGTAAALDLSGRILRACWIEERDIASAATLAALLADAGLDSGLLQAAGSELTRARYERHTQEAIAADVFGAPSYVIGGEIFWGQDRLDFVERRLASG